MFQGLEWTPAPVRQIRNPIKVNAVSSPSSSTRSFVLEFLNSPWSIFSPAVAFYLLKRRADFTQGEASTLPDTINTSPESCVINSRLISKADTVMCRGEGEGGGLDDAKLSLWRYPVPPSRISRSHSWGHETAHSAVCMILSHCFALFLTGFRIWTT